MQHACGCPPGRACILRQRLAVAASETGCCSVSVDVRSAAAHGGHCSSLQMSMHDCVFYYWSDEQWDSCDKFREAATPILNPTGNPDLLDWRASGTQVLLLLERMLCSAQPCRRCRSWEGGMGVESARGQL